MRPREARQWRAVGMAGAGAVALLGARLVMIRAGESRSVFELARRTFGAVPPAATWVWREEIERRLAAVEEHLQTLPPERVS